MNKILCTSMVVLIVTCINAWAGTSHFPAPASANTWCDYAGYLDIDSTEAQIGDEIAFLSPAGEIKGVVVLSKPGQYLLHVYEGEGIYNGIALGVSIWDQSSRIEYNGNAICLFSGDLGGSTQPSSIPPQWVADGFFSLNIQVKTMGDINGDCELDLSDAILALKISSGIAVAGVYLPEKNAGEMDKIGTADALFILQKTAGLR
ncbi:MAG: hypothetical protein GXP53_01755 [Deltaproteobacteria bacterium]|nr:hypothetical protein [Deltaproteobacteria bacterium]